MYFYFCSCLADDVACAVTIAGRMWQSAGIAGNISRGDGQEAAVGTSVGGDLNCEFST